MSIEQNFQDNNPNLEPEYDVIGELHEAQEYYDSLDPFDQWTWGQHRADEIAEQLGDKLIRVSMELGAFSVQIAGSEGYYSYNDPESQALKVEGYVGCVGTGFIAGSNGFYAGLVETNIRFQDPLTGLPLDAAILAPIPKTFSYTYLPE